MNPKMNKDPKANKDPKECVFSAAIGSEEAAVASARYKEASLPLTRNFPYIIGTQHSPVNSFNYMYSDSAFTCDSVYNLASDCSYPDYFRNQSNSNGGSYKREISEISQQLDKGTFDSPELCLHPYLKTDADNEQDMGYSSHSTCSSSHVMEHNSQVDISQASEAPWSDYEDGFARGGDDVDDLIHQFKRYFEGRIEHVLNEQQIHIRQIVNKAINKYQGQQLTNQNEVSSPPCKKANLADESYFPLSSPPTSTESHFHDELYDNNCVPLQQWDTNYRNQNQADHTFLSPAPTQTFVTELQHCPGVTNNFRNTEKSQKDQQLLKIFSLTCAVNNLLQKPEFKS